MLCKNNKESFTTGTVAPSIPGWLLAAHLIHSEEEAVRLRGEMILAEICWQKSIFLILQYVTLVLFCNTEQCSACSTKVGRF